jgi:hypothetical protein
MFGPLARFTGLATVTTLVLTGVGCGGTDDGVGPDPSDPNGPGDPLAVVGDTIYAVDLNGAFLMFGSGSTESVSRTTQLQGVPAGRRLVGLDYRPSDGRLYGVGNDSRVYVVDPVTSTATPVSATPFSPAIDVDDDVHFGMGFDPATNEIRLISAETAVSWTIDADDGTAVVDGLVRYVDGDPNEGETPRISGFTFIPAGAAPAPGDAAAAGPLCEERGYAIDAGLDVVIGMCVHESTEFETLFELSVAVLRCGEVTFDSRGNLMIISLSEGENRIGRMDPETGDVDWLASVPSPSPIQAIAMP